MTIARRIFRRMVKTAQTFPIRPPKIDSAAGRRNEEAMDLANAPSA